MKHRADSLRQQNFLYCMTGATTFVWIVLYCDQSKFVMPMLNLLEIKTHARTVQL